jgi:hypothetical protein
LEQSIIKGSSIHKFLVTLKLESSFIVGPKEFVYIQTPSFSTIFSTYKDIELEALAKLSDSLKTFVKKI